MLKARVTLQNLKTLSYTFPDKDVSLAEEFTQQLDELYRSFYLQLPNEAGLIILPQTQESIRSTKKGNTQTETQNMQIYHPGRNTKKVWIVDLALRLIGYERTLTIHASQTYVQTNATFILLSPLTHVLHV
jgi:hypothetical protein